MQIIAVAQPIYVYELAQQPPADATPASRGNPGQQGVDQYVIEKLKLADVHRVVKGTNVPIAVIDSEIDAAHPDLQGVIAQRFSAVGAPEKPHAHGTGMAGAIGSHQKVLGIAPGRPPDRGARLQHQRGQRREHHLSTSSRASTGR